MITGKNKTKLLVKVIPCKCKCTFDARKCNLNQKWNNDQCQCECKNITCVKKNTFGILLHAVAKLEK